MCVCVCGWRLTLSNNSRICNLPTATHQPAVPSSTSSAVATIAATVATFSATSTANTTFPSTKTPNSTPTARPPAHAISATATTRDGKRRARIEERAGIITTRRTDPRARPPLPRLDQARNPLRKGVSSVELQSRVPAAYPRIGPGAPFNNFESLSAIIDGIITPSATTINHRRSLHFLFSGS